MTLAVFDAPWYTWPTTGALIAVFGALIVARFTYWCYCRLKLRDGVQKVRDDLQRYRNAVSLLCVPSPNVGGERFIKHIGDWDGFCTILNELKASIESLEVYGDRHTISASQQLIILTQNLYKGLHVAFVNYQSPSRRQKDTTLLFDHDDEVKEIESKWREIVWCSRNWRF